MFFFKFKNIIKKLVSQGVNKHNGETVAVKTFNQVILFSIFMKIVNDILSTNQLNGLNAGFTNDTLFQPLSG